MMVSPPDRGHVLEQPVPEFFGNKRQERMKKLQGVAHHEIKHGQYVRLAIGPRRRMSPRTMYQSQYSLQKNGRAWRWRQ